MSGEFALAHPEELSSRIVIENSASVSSCFAKSPLELAITDREAPVEKIPAAVCLAFSAILQTLVTARARSCGVAAAVAEKWRATFRYFWRPSMGSRSGFFG